MVVLCPIILQLIFLFGIPQVITTNQGREFHNSLNQEMTTALGIQHSLTTAYSA